MRMTGYPAGPVDVLERGRQIAGTSAPIRDHMASQARTARWARSRDAPAAGSGLRGRCHRKGYFGGGYSDGTILMVRLNDGAEFWCAGTHCAGRGTGWKAKGTMLAFAAEDGDAGLLEL